MTTIDLNSKIKDALNDDNIVKIMNKASRRFKNQLDKDTIYTCQLNALWKTFVNYDSSKGAKFTTYLFNGVFIECMKEIKFSSRLLAKATGKLHDNLTKHDNSKIIYEILDELQDPVEKEIFLDKLSNMTILEISKKHNTNRESARRKIHQIIRKIQKKFM